MPIGAISPAAAAQELNNVRSMQLSMESSPGAAAPAGTAVASPVATSSEAAGQATLGAENVQPTPTGSPMKSILGSVLKGAMTGASVVMGVNTLGGKIPWVKGFLGGVISKLPFLSRFGFPMGTLAALGIGAAVGAVFGLLSGIRKAKAAAAAAAAQAAAPVPETPAPTTPAPVLTPPPSKPKKAKKRKVKRNPVAGTSKAKGKRRSQRLGFSPDTSKAHHIKSGDTLWALSRRYDVSIDSIVKANSDIIKDPDLIYTGDTIAIPV
jgi:nucleoid-associated protein YgaU